MKSDPVLRFLEYRDHTVRGLQSVDPRVVHDAALMLTDDVRMGNNVFIIGNGGSLANAVHIASDLARAGGLRRVFDPLALAYLTAVANDESYENIFRRYLEARAMPGDTLIALSVSKTSPNILAACEYWKGKGDIIGLWGKQHPAGADVFADVSIFVEEDDPRIVETVHLAIGQAWTTMVRE